MHFKASLTLGCLVALILAIALPGSFREASHASAAECQPPKWQSLPDVHNNLHPYAQTGVQRSLCWTVNVRFGDNAIVGGYEINGSREAPYRVYRGPTSFTLTALDGFVEIAHNSDTHDQWCFRLLQARSNKWAPPDFLDKAISQSVCGQSTMAPSQGTVPTQPQQNVVVSTLPRPVQQGSTPAIPATNFTSPPEENRAECAAIYRTRFEPGSGYKSFTERQWFLDNCHNYVVGVETPLPSVKPPASAKGSAPGCITVNCLPRRDTSTCAAPCQVNLGEAVTGFFVFNIGDEPKGNCYWDYVTVTVWMTDGAVNPYRPSSFGNELAQPCSAPAQQPAAPPPAPASQPQAQTPVCLHSETVNCMERRLTGDIQAKEAVTGNFTLHQPNGDMDYGPCYWKEVPYPGYLRGGVANPYAPSADGDERDKTICQQK